MAHSDAAKGRAEFLATVPLFAKCDASELRAIVGAGRDVTHSAGQVICREGEAGGGMHVVTAGEVEVRVKGSQSQSRLGPGSFFGEIALLDGGPRSATVTASTDVTTFSIPSWSFRPILESQPHLTLKLLEVLCGRLRQNESSPTH